MMFGHFDPPPHSPSPAQVAEALAEALTTLSIAAIASLTACPGHEPGFFISCTLTSRTLPFSYTLNLLGCVPLARGFRSAQLAPRAVPHGTYRLEEAVLLIGDEGAGSVRGYQTIRTSMRCPTFLKPLSRVIKGAFKCFAVAAITASGSLSLYVRFTKAE